MSKKKKSKKKQLNKQKPLIAKASLYNPPIKTAYIPKKEINKGKTSPKYKKKPNKPKKKEASKKTEVVLQHKTQSIQEIKEPKKEIQNKKEAIEPKKETQKPKEEPKKKKINLKLITILLLIVITILSIVIYNIYIAKKEEYNRKTNYIVQSNIDGYKVYFKDEKNNTTESLDVKEDTSIETYARYNTIHIENKINNEELTFNQEDSYFKYYGDNNYLLTSNGSYEIKYIYFNSNADIKLSFESNNDNIIIKNNIITCNKSGDSSIYAIYGDKKIKLLDIKSSTLIVERPKEFDETKQFLTCEQYTKEENDELDLLLETKINEVGYKTRAGAVEALRFMTLDLPYRVQYFYENGRYPYVDGEGRYYHKGLYLSTDRYNSLSRPNAKNKGTWGCKLYSEPYGTKMENGLDCSGLMCWALFNGGYDPDDIRGANLLLELGELVKTKKAIESGKIKVGDFVHNYEGESHIGMIIGIDDEYYYVAQAIWYKPNGVCITKFTKEEMVKRWIDVVLLDEYYKDDGNLTNMWY